MIHIKNVRGIIKRIPIPLKVPGTLNSIRSRKMSHIIKKLSNKVTKMELESTIPNIPPPQGRNTNQFRRPYNMQMMYREKRSEEQPLLPLVRENNSNNSFYFLEE